MNKNGHGLFNKLFQHFQQ